MNTDPQTTSARSDLLAVARLADEVNDPAIRDALTPVLVRAIHGEFRAEWKAREDEAECYELVPMEADVMEAEPGWWGRAVVVAEAATGA